MFSQTLTVLVYFLTSPTITNGPYRVGTPTKGQYVERCEATVFCFKGDKWCGGATPYLLRRVRPNDRGVAHRTLPFGTTLRITNLRTKLSTTARVVDRGPFGRINVRGYWYNGIHFYRKFFFAKKPIPTKTWSKGVEGWRGCLDITPIVGHAIRHNGKEDVIFEVVKWPRRLRKPVRRPNT